MDVFDQFHRRLTAVENAVKRAQTGPTIPSYDSQNWPDEAVPGQMAKDRSQNVWIHGSDSQWHQIGSNFPSCFARTVNAPDFSGAGSLIPEWGAGSNDFLTSDPTIFNLDADRKYINTPSNGLFLITGYFLPNWSTTQISSVVQMETRCRRVSDDAYIATSPYWYIDYVDGTPTVPKTVHILNGTVPLNNRFTSGGPFQFFSLLAIGQAISGFEIGLSIVRLSTSPAMPS